MGVYLGGVHVYFVGVYLGGVHVHFLGVYLGGVHVTLLSSSSDKGMDSEDDLDVH